MLHPDTAARHESVWTQVGRAQFDQNVNELKRETELPAVAKIYDLNKWQGGTCDGHLISLDLERQIADDFAFIAAYEEGVNTVTAATVQILHQSLRITLAANEGIQRRVKDALQSLFGDLEQCARLNLSSDACSARVFDIIVRLNRNRIYGRLGSHKYVPPPHRLGSRPQSLTADLKGLLAGRSSPKSEEREEIATELDSLDTDFQSIEVLAKSEDLEAVKILLKKAFSLTVDGVSFRTRLERCGVSSRSVDTKQVQQLMKIANYWRICDNMAKTARSYRQWFSSIELSTLESYHASEWQGVKRFVHAEVQIVAHFELHRVDTRPRVIGASKEACFLCDSFLRAHKWFFLSRAHRQLYEKWTIPDLREYDRVSRLRLQRALSMVNKEVRTLLEDVRRMTPRRHYPIQSSINLTRAFIRESSRSTIRPYSPPGSHGTSIIGSVSTLKKTGASNTQIQHDVEADYFELVSHHEESGLASARQHSPDLILKNESATGDLNHLDSSKLETQGLKISSTGAVLDVRGLSSKTTRRGASRRHGIGHSGRRTSLAIEMPRRRILRQSAKTKIVQSSHAVNDRPSIEEVRGQSAKKTAEKYSRPNKTRTKGYASKHGDYSAKTSHKEGKSKKPKHTRPKKEARTDPSSRSKKRKKKTAFTQAQAEGRK